MGDGEGGESFSEWLNIIDADGKVVCELPGHSQYARGTDASRKEDANAELICSATAELASLREENRELREALGFYADKKKWADVETGVGCYPGDAIDYGATARAILARTTHEGFHASEGKGAT